MLNIAFIEEKSLIYGPGIRFVFWVQGCSIRCKGCWNKELWEFKPKNLYKIEDLIRQIEKIKNDIEGITILGGEPLDQYKEILELSKKVKNLNLSIILYTGYPLKIVEKKYNEILNYIDILISEPYNETKRDITNGGIIGSTNQKITFYSSKYTLKDLTPHNEIEISIDEDNGSIKVYGYIEDDIDTIINNF